MKLLQLLFSRMHRLYEAIPKTTLYFKITLVYFLLRLFDYYKNLCKNPIEQGRKPAGPLPIATSENVSSFYQDDCKENLDRLYGPSFSVISLFNKLPVAAG